MSAPRALSMSSGTVARVIPDPLQEDAVILLVDGAEQSHVYRSAQDQIFYEYLQRISHGIDARFSEGSARALGPLTVAHLGAGALTLPRSVAVRRPGSRQVVVDIERELVDFVARHIPLPAGVSLFPAASGSAVLDNTPPNGIASVVADAGDFIAAAVQGDGERFDVVVLDIFSGKDSPAHLANAQFYRDCRAALVEDGLLVVNIGDDEGMHFARGQIRALQEVYDDVAVTGSAELFTGRFAGNLVALASDRTFTAEECGAVLGAGPHPAALLRGVELDEFSRG